MEEVRTSAAVDRYGVVVHSVAADHCVAADRCVVVVHGAPVDPILVTRIGVVVAVAAQMVQAARNADLAARCVVRGEVHVEVQI